MATGILSVTASTSYNGWNIDCWFVHCASLAAVPCNFGNIVNQCKCCTFYTLTIHTTRHKSVRTHTPTHTHTHTHTVFDARMANCCWLYIFPIRTRSISRSAPPTPSLSLSLIVSAARRSAAWLPTRQFHRCCLTDACWPCEASREAGCRQVCRPGL